jgi:hypothetical protein
MAAADYILRAKMQTFPRPDHCRSVIPIFLVILSLLTSKKLNFSLDKAQHDLYS